MLYTGDLPKHKVPGAALETPPGRHQEHLMLPDSTTPGPPEALPADDAAARRAADFAALLDRYDPTEPSPEPYN